MKKLILFAAILFAGVSLVKAQAVAKNGDVTTATQNEYTATTGATATDKTSSTLLTVELSAIQAISINTSNVTLRYSTIEDYEKGVSNSIDNHLNVYSTGGYAVGVHYVTPEATGAFSNSSLTLENLFNSISVGISDGTFNKSTNLVKDTSTESAITSVTGAINKKYNVVYTGAGKAFDDTSKGYMDYIKGEGPQTLTATVVYTIAAQ